MLSPHNKGSANSWVLDKLVNAHGGLYNRVTYEIKLEPFTLAECREFYRFNNIRFSNYDIVQSYMVLGGIPYYMGYIEGDKSLAQSIDDCFFARNARLRDEYNRLFVSAFDNPETAKSIVGFLFSRSAGYTRREIAEHLKIAEGGSLSKNLNALMASDFIVKYVPFGFGKRECHYKLIDPFCLFYLQFVYGKANLREKFWQQNTSSQSLSTWRGYAFENVCFNHIEQIKKALGISGVITTSSAWSKRSEDSKGT